MSKRVLWPLLGLMAIMGLGACGVQGPPKPPLTPPELGRGRPSFKRATEGFKFPDVPPVQSDPATKTSPNETEH